ncbi:MAG TPA: twin-arginine translocation signal domain-containing protein [Candidatus Dormibacteraeota bacterium]|nr:twin-arginine translocation signal domain-containing protein [Candidatus Dormibacteraeota bacterium]
MPTVTRRDFLKFGAAGAGAVALSGLGFEDALADSTQIKQNLRIAGAKESHSICPYCAVGCSLVAYTRQNSDGTTQLLQIEGDPDSPVNEGRLCPKGATAMQLAISPRRVESPQYRAPGATAWKAVGWDFVLDKIANNIKASRDASFVATDGNGNTVNRTEGIAFAGGAAFSSEEGYFATKLMRGLGLVHLEQQARV